MATRRESGGSSRVGTGPALSVPQTQFPAINSPQRLGSSTPSLQSTSRSKVELKPGRSLMDWIRLGKSGQDLTGVGGTLTNVTKEELSKHNKEDDVWMCIKGKVFNVTSYLEYHPGGVQELMRGAGNDATQLFNEVHKWVNYESMLEKCFVGKLEVTTSRQASARSLIGVKAPPPFVESSPLHQENKMDYIDGKTENDNNYKQEANKQIPKHDWFQSDSTVTIVIYTKCKTMSEDRVMVVKTNSEIYITIFIEESVLDLQWDLEEDVGVEHQVRVGNSGKVEIVFIKETQGKQWSCLGMPLFHHNTFKKTSERDVQYFSCTLKSRESITHDSYLLCFELPIATRMPVPMGYHVYLKVSVEEMDLIRPYTVVLPSLVTNQIAQEILNGRIFYLIIKLYPEGALTSVINKLQIGDQVLISNPEGNFNQNKYISCQRLLLVSAGTGFTPMVRLLHHALHFSHENRQIHMLFFNKTQQDILWREQLEKLQEDNRFHCTHILSAAEDDWDGPTGRIRSDILESFAPKPSSDAQTLICICGPTPFTMTAVQLFEEFGYKQDEIHAFLG
ncbi:cytochrome b5 reductase 4-like [Saccoglossus kowalevskii]|uniref:Cytochrome b5 reductase 4 n=1 Tax=Saccoglossus kowalevskii TaxID=10224 RepID=A0ABM0MSV4_SACKO|nr:PREDICTED: cytochrome b5 reductase 4-like [Saccoglossus kowalevskii]